MKKNNKGFTLVELIVVIVILGILAAVAVPAYSGYINRSRRSADLSVLSSVATAAQALAAEKNKVLTEIQVTRSSGAITVKDNTTPTPADVTDTLGGQAAIWNLANGGTTYTSWKATDWDTATWTSANGTWTFTTTAA